jgi:hypothetical protein
MRERRWIVAGWVAVLLAGCGGGSGSTGLITSEVAVIDHVRDTGTCDEFAGAPYCAADSPDAVAPGGQSVSVVTDAPTPARTPTPGTGGPTPSGGGPLPSPTAAPPTPAPTATAAATAVAPTHTPTPARTATVPQPTATPVDAASVTAVVAGFDAGAACATAARPAGTEDPWQTAALVPVDASGEPVVFPLPADVASPREAALLCFADAPGALAPELATLVDADPTVVFVLPSP